MYGHVVSQRSCMFVVYSIIISFIEFGIKILTVFNSFSSAAEITRAKPTWYFAGSYLRFSACYVDENNTIRFCEKFPIDTYNKMSTL